MILTIVILVLFALFWLAELIAYLTHYAYGRTVSAWIEFSYTSKRWGMLARIGIAALVALLFTHLEFQIP